MCRDVTEARKRDDALVKIRVHEAMFATMVRTIRDEIDPVRMLNTAARVLVEGFAASGCVIFRINAEGNIRESASFGHPPEGPVAEAVRAVENGVSDIEFTPRSDETRALACPTRYQGRRNGAIFVARSDRRRWATDERALLAGVAERIGIAQVELFEEEGVDMNRVYIGHCNDSTDMEYLTAILSKGAWLGLDRTGVLGEGVMMPDWRERARTIKRLIDA
ncbi:MAG: GAF domain-containing protein, partial [Alphaproteobacteria bacterium]